MADRDPDVNPVVQCCPWKSGAGATRIRQHILHSGQAAKCKGSSEEYKAMKSKLLEKEPPPQRDPVEASVRRVCMAALRKENEQVKDENARLRAHVAALEEMRACVHRLRRSRCTRDRSIARHEKHA